MFKLRTICWIVACLEVEYKYIVYSSADSRFVPSQWETLLRRLSFAGRTTKIIPAIPKFYLAIQFLNQTRVLL